MKEKYYDNSKDYINRWVISYADLVTLLLALFLVTGSFGIKGSFVNKVVSSFVE